MSRFLDNRYLRMVLEFIASIASPVSALHAYFLFNLHLRSNALSSAFPKIARGEIDFASRNPKS